MLREKHPRPGLMLAISDTICAPTGVLGQNRKTSGGKLPGASFPAPCSSLADCQNHSGSFIVQHSRTKARNTHRHLLSSHPTQLGHAPNHHHRHRSVPSIPTIAAARPHLPPSKTQSYFAKPCFRSSQQCSIRHGLSVPSPNVTCLQK